MSCSFGNALRVSIFGQSHSDAIGAVVDGLPAGVRIDIDEVRRFMARRAPGGALATQRRETDEPIVLSGLVDGVTCGAPVAAMIKNSDHRSSDYEKMRDLPRPMHADLPAAIKYCGANDIRGGGQFSGRLTAPLCFAGAIAIQLLASRGVHVGAHIASIGKAHDAPFDPMSVCESDLAAVRARELPVVDDASIAAMTREVTDARAAGDSVGGAVECAACGVPAGIGEPICDSVESRAAAIIFSIPAVRAVEFGAGASAAAMRGSEHNDAYAIRDGKIVTQTNRHGGVLGGITTGMPIILRAAFKPTPTIAIEQNTVSLSRMEPAVLAAAGRHDPCVVLRAVPCVEAALALALFDLMLESKGRDEWISKSAEKI